MNITDVRVRKVTKEGKMKAVVSITIDDEFVVHDIKVIEGEKGLFIAMPSRKATDGEYRDIAHPINSKTRSEIQEIILQKYEETLAAEEAETDEQPEAADSSEAVPEEAPSAEAPGTEGMPEG
jgi:stage V sporulation protein G